MTADVVLAHHALITAIPFVVPAFIVVALIGVIVWRDLGRRRRRWQNLIAGEHVIERPNAVRQMAARTHGDHS